MIRFGGKNMPKPYSYDLRVRVIELIEAGSSRISPLEVHAEVLLGRIVEQPDLTLDEVVVAMSKAGIIGSRTAVWRFYERHDISFKKNSVCGGAEARGCRARTSAVDAPTRHV